MAYTINKLARLSGVSVRTLHYYDEIGLLKPAHVGDNNYRYYAEAELLQLQQILFYRELGIQLNDIKRILSAPDFDRINALESHRIILEKNLNHTKTLIETINKTISHLKGNNIMKLEEVFHGFTEDKQKLYEDFLVDSGVSQGVIHQARDKVKSWTKDQWMDSKRKGDAIHTALVEMMSQGLAPSSHEVQEVIERHYQITTAFWTPNRDSYIGLSELYGSHPDFVQFYADIHPGLLSYLQQAMEIYANNQLK